MWFTWFQGVAFGLILGWVSMQIGMHFRIGNWKKILK